MTFIRAVRLAREALLTGPPVFRLNSLVREALVSGSGAVLPLDVVVRVTGLAR